MITGYWSPQFAVFHEFQQRQLKENALWIFPDFRIYKATCTC